MKDNNIYGSDNPHPLSKIKTELIWEGKYDEYGNRRPVNLPSTPFPLQKIETIDEPRDRERAIQGDLFDRESFDKKAHKDDFRNMLIWGDNKLVMASLLEQYRGKIDLIYIDPPFDVGEDFTLQVHLGDEKDKLYKEQSILEAVAYRDTWGKGTDSYLNIMYERLLMMKELLAEHGAIFLHCDWRVSSSIKIIMDEIFGIDNFRNEIIWRKLTAAKAQSNFFSNVKDTVLYYVKNNKFGFFNPQFLPLDSKNDLKTYRFIEEKTGRRYGSFDFTQKGQGPARMFGNKLLSPPGGKHWIWSQEKIDEGLKNGLIFFNKKGTPRLKRYLDEKQGNWIGDLWYDEDVKPLSSNDSERTDYNTQKPESLLERIVKVSSNVDNLIADFFCGSGTTLAVAEKLGRRWIGVDLGRYAIHVSRKRLIQTQRELHSSGQTYRSFDVYNLGRYERQWWQIDRLKGKDDEHRAIVLKFYKAARLDNPPNPLMHGKKNGAFVYIDQIDGIFTGEKLKIVAEAARSVGGKELHCLAWEFEMELALKKYSIEKEHDIAIKLKYIPREIMEPNRTECQFFEAGYLEAKIIINKDKYQVQLINFSPSLAEAPEKEMEELRERAVKSPFDFIDFWAVDFDYNQNKPFEHHWQDFRTRKDRSLKIITDIKWEYTSSGKHQICVKVIDVFGVDTSSILEVEV